MKKFIYRIRTLRSKPSSDFSAFFVESKASEKKKLVKEVVREANNDQKKLVREAEKVLSATN